MARKFPISDNKEKFPAHSPISSLVCSDTAESYVVTCMTHITSIRCGPPNEDVITWGVSCATVSRTFNYSNCERTPVGKASQWTIASSRHLKQRINSRGHVSAVTQKHLSSSHQLREKKKRGSTKDSPSRVPPSRGLGKCSAVSGAKPFQRQVQSSPTRGRDDIPEC